MHGHVNLQPKFISIIYQIVSPDLMPYILNVIIESTYMSTYLNNNGISMIALSMREIADLYSKGKNKS